MCDASLMQGQAAQAGVNLLSMESPLNAEDECSQNGTDERISKTQATENEVTVACSPQSHAEGSTSSNLNGQDASNLDLNQNKGETCAEQNLEKVPRSSESTLFNTSRHDYNVPWVCKSCKLTIDDLAAAVLECDVCKQHCCPKCISLTKTQYAAALRNDFMWICSPDCKDTIYKALHHVTNRSEQDQLNEHFSKMEHDMRMMEARIDSRMKRLERSLTGVTSPTKTLSIWEDNEQMSRSAMLNGPILTLGNSMSIVPPKPPTDQQATKMKTYASAAQPSQKQTQVELPTMKGLFKEVLNENEREKVMRIKRENNIIIYHVKEEGKGRTERQEKDLEAAKALFVEIGAEDAEIEEIERLGRPEAGKERPMRLKMGNQQDKCKIMTNLRFLREAPDPICNYSVSHDLTPTQRDQRNSLLDEVKTKNEGHQDADAIRYKMIVVPGPTWDAKVVKLKARPSKK